MRCEVGPKRVGYLVGGQRIMVWVSTPLPHARMDMDLLDKLEVLTHPAAQTVLLALSGLIFLGRRHFRIGAALLSLAVMWIWLCSSPASAIWLQNRLEKPYANTAPFAYPRADAIVVLGGGALPSSAAPWDDTDADATRLGLGLQLFRSTRARVMLLAGADQARAMSRKLRDQGVPSVALITEDHSTNTYQNALFSARLLKRRRLQRILLVTSGIHMPRASATFAKQGLTVIPAPVLKARTGFSEDSPPWWPNRAALTLTTRCLREYLGRWGYHLRGWA